MSQQIIITEKQLKKLSNMLEEQTNTIRAYSFDWDDNILKMPTTIKMLKKTDSGWEPINVGTEQFALVRDNENYKLADGAFDNFINEDSFLIDLQKALDDKAFAPSLVSLRKH